MKKIIRGLLIIINICGIICLIYYGCLFLSGSTIVDYPDAMIPYTRWEAGGTALTIGLIPLTLANSLEYLSINDTNKKRKMIIFIPSILCLILVIAFWIMEFL